MLLRDDSLRISVNDKRLDWFPMELQENLDLIYDVDAVLRGQGADAAILRARRPGSGAGGGESHAGKLLLASPQGDLPGV